MSTKKKKTSKVSKAKKGKRGKLIVIDGTDGSGKATQVKILYDRLKRDGVKVKTIDFPRYKDNVLGSLIRECLDGKHGDFVSLSPRVASVLYAVDRFESAPEIDTWLASGYHVIANRYTTANQMHQGGKIAEKKKRREFLEWLDHLEHSLLGIPRPDLVLYLHLPLEVSLALIAKRAEETGTFPDSAERNTRYLFQAQQGALAIVKEKNAWTKIDCSRNGQILSRDDISELIMGVVEKVL